MRLLLKDIPIRVKVLLMFAVFGIVALLLIVFSAYYFKSRESVVEFRSQVSRLEALSTKWFYVQDEFLLHESINPTFFATDSSELLNLGSRYHERISDLLSTLRTSNSFAASPEMWDLLARADAALSQQQQYFEDIVEVLKVRGFKDYGAEGEMRTHAHKLEESFVEMVHPAALLTLRRHEKDFIIRREERYVELFGAAYHALWDRLVSQPGQEGWEALEELEAYGRWFKQVVHTERAIGLKENSGLKSKLERANHAFDSVLQEILVRTEAHSDRQLARFDAYFIIGLVLFVLLAIASGIYLSRQITRRLLYVSDSMSRFVESNFTSTTAFSSEIGRDEIGRLAKNFQLLEEEIVVHFANYRERAEKRTEEILRQNTLLENHKSLIERKNRDILDSIQYARRIQRSILPSDRHLSQLLPDHFLLYQPRDIVSGDFYWAELAGDHLVVAVADCTGHGVPGALMSMLGHNFLNQAVIEREITSPAMILSYLNVSIMTSLDRNNVGGELIRDGMDISVVSINRKTGVLTFAGAQRPIFVIRGDEMIQLKGNRLPVGGFVQGGSQFEEESLDISGGASIYLFSDGYSDQFGGELGKKFKLSNMRSLIFSVRHDELEDQQRALNESLRIWMGKTRIKLTISVCWAFESLRKTWGLIVLHD